MNDCIKEKCGSGVGFADDSAHAEVQWVTGIGIHVNQGRMIVDDRER